MVPACLLDLINVKVTQYFSLSIHIPILKMFARNVTIIAVFVAVVPCLFARPYQSQGDLALLTLFHSLSYENPSYKPPPKLVNLCTHEYQDISVVICV